MTLTLIKPPALEPVTLAQARQFLRLDDGGEDELLAGLVKAARETLEMQAGLVLIDQIFRLHVDRWPAQGLVSIAKHPVRAIVSVTAYGKEGAPVPIAGNEMHLEAASRPARLHLGSRPAGTSALDIDFTAGFGETGADVPDALRHAILNLVAHWYEYRGVDGAARQYPPAFERTAGLWRRVSI
ncbi:MAG: head-tail connector protein [Phyllobacterium sp.]